MIMFLKVEKISERKVKMVDAKHLLFLWGEWTVKQSWLGLNVWFVWGVPPSMWL